MFSMLDPAPDNEQRVQVSKTGCLNELCSCKDYSQVQTSILSKPQNFVFSTQKSAKYNFDQQIKVSFLHSSSLIIFYLLVLTHKW